jgi:ElaB/YqjD/DUF883 family membrane-anchored ribosome-binding protein
MGCIDILLQKGSDNMARRTSPTTDQSIDDIVSEFRDLASSLDELLAASGVESGDALAALKAKATDRVKQAKVAITKFERNAVQAAKDVATKSDDYVHDNPWTSIAVGAGAGLILGLLIGRR